MCCSHCVYILTRISKNNEDSKLSMVIVGESWLFTIQYNTIRYDATRSDATRRDAMRCDAMRCDAIQYNTFISNIEHNYITIAICTPHRKGSNVGGQKNNLIVVHPNIN